MINGELLVDGFAGGGGTSTGMEEATGFSPDIAVNHDPEAIRMHKMNHPNTRHYCESIWDVNPIKVCEGHPVALAWFSPDCKHFSKAKGGTPVEKKIRGLAWVALRWAGTVHPRVIMLENVEEFQTWGPLRVRRDPKTHRVMKYNRNGGIKSPNYVVAAKGEVVDAKDQVMEPDPKKKGMTFHRFVEQLTSLGYKVEFRELVAADYGAPTSRKRFFMIARRDGRPIIWPKKTHAQRNSEAVKSGKLKPYVSAASCIDFTLPCPSIFESSEEIKKKYGIRAVRPLAEKTMRRIALGLKKFVIDCEEPFVVQVNHSGSEWHYCRSMEEPLPVITGKHGFGIVEPFMVQIGQTGFAKDRSKTVEELLNTIVSKNEHCLIAPTLVQYHSETSENGARGQKVEEPLSTVDGSNRYGLVTSFLSKFYKTGIGQDLNEPMHTITTSQGHFGEVRAFLVKYYGNGDGQDVNEPLDTITSHDRFGLVTIKGVKYQIVDIGLRMLEPRELYNAQGFPEDYIIEKDYTGKKYPRSEQVKRCGNAVCPPIPAALIRANLPELCIAKRTPNLVIKDGTNGQLKFC